MVRDILLFSLVAVCLFTDLSERKIYNKVVLTGTVLALILNLFQYGLTGGLFFTLTGFFTGIFLLILPFILGGIGAGDVKMLGMIGAFVGYSRAVEVLLAGAAVGGVLAVIQVMRHGGSLRRLRRVLLSFFMFIFTGKSVYLCRPEEEENPSAIPYGAALGAGVIIVYVLSSMDKAIPNFIVSAL